ncbi:TIGR00341 family protein [Aquimarina addita]|uniref:TIGR00341 family protein n=1 Tax=Aquimarina addita TaxID=870485 RepID=A0ABP7XF55_9FLAO
MAENTQNPGEQNQDKKVEEHKETVKKDAKGLFTSVITFLRELLDIRSDTDRDKTIEDVKNDIPFKGHNAWILIFSVFVASIGLNVSSTAVVIGAMLISPLMGPIVGVGLSIAINDIDTLRRSLVNLGVMVGLSLITATIYFVISPLTELTPELASRTAPTILDVFVAISGGLALVIAKTKKGTMPNAIAGVAIATALMPPLCTAGYGIAVWKPLFFLGAMYLFCINAIFIALSTFIVAKLLRFPMIRYANSAKRKFVARIASFVAILAMIPATYTFYSALNRSKAEQDYKNFMANEIDNNENLILRKPFYDYENKSIRLYFDGEIADATVSDLQNELKKYEEIKGFTLKVSGNKARGLEQISKANDRYIVELNRMERENEAYITEIDALKEKLVEMNNQLSAANKTGTFNVLTYSAIAKDAKIKFPDLSELGYGQVLQSNFVKIDTLKVIYPTWKFKVVDSVNAKRNNNLRGWITKELKVDTLLIR